MPSHMTSNWGRLDGTWWTEDPGPLSPVRQHYGSYDGPINWQFVRSSEVSGVIRVEPGWSATVSTKSLEGIKKVSLGRDFKISTSIDLVWKRVNRTSQMYTSVCTYCSTFNLTFVLFFVSVSLLPVFFV